jgi:hypothetical protein
MNADQQLERILADDDRVEVSSGFAARVMLAVDLERSRESVRSVGIWQRGWPWATAAALALVSAMGAQALRELTVAIPGVGSELASWCSLIVPLSIVLAYLRIGGFSLR